MVRSTKPGVAEWLAEGGKKMEEVEMKAPDLVHIRTVPYDLECNWKVFNDNYLVRPISMPGYIPCLCGQTHEPSAVVFIRIKSGAHRQVLPKCSASGEHSFSAVTQNTAPYGPICCRPHGMRAM
jgi:hypothetical protein